MLVNHVERTLTDFPEVGNRHSSHDKPRSTSVTKLTRPMLRVPRYLATAALAWAVVVFPARAAAARAFAYNDPGWEGTSELLSIARRTLGHARVRLVSELDYHALSGADRLLILAPGRELDVDSLTAFLEAGGRLALLDDFGHGETVFSHFSVTRRSGLLFPRESLGQNPNLAVARPSGSSAPPEASLHPLLLGVDRVVLNHPTVLVHTGLTPILEIPSERGPNPAVAITAVVGGEKRGRILMMSDPSSVINLMLRYPGNRAFAEGIVRYLAEGSSGATTGTLYLLANDFAERGSFGKPDGPLSELGRTLGQALPPLSGPFPRPHLLVVAALLALTVLALARTLLFQGSLPRLPRYTRPLSLMAQAGWPGRAAVLTAATTSAALPILELRLGLERHLAKLLRQPAGTPLPLLLEALSAREAIDGGTALRLKGLLAEFGEAERAVVSRRHLRRSRARLLKLNNEVLDILERISQGLASPRERN